MENKNKFTIGLNPWLLGVCDGIANYISMDVKLVRIAVVIISYLITHSLIMNFLLYVVIAFFMPQHKNTYQIDREYRTKK